MLIKAMFNMCTASCYNRRKAFPKLPYCPTNQILADSFQTGYRNFLQIFHVPNLLLVNCM